MPHLIFYAIFFLLLLSEYLSVFFYYYSFKKTDFWNIVPQNLSEGIEWGEMMIGNYVIAFEDLKKRQKSISGAIMNLARHNRELF